ncbi:MAG: ACT domain-containing protein [Pseudomonadota bacterium]
MSAGERDLAKLLGGLVVTHRPGRWVFETRVDAPNLSSVAMAFAEVEGWTVIRQAGPDDGAAFAWLELSVHSSLEAVGFLAAISTALATVGVPCNAVAAYHHDHIFVPEGLVETAISAIEALRQTA